jgi:2-amino-4-hydroxy-6-hydroxymethyldihydropteridine diphosphokinase
MTRSDNPNFVCVLLGSNIRPEDNIVNALHLLSQHYPIHSISTAWETPAIGLEGPDFLNLAVAFYSTSDPTELKINQLRPMEQLLGRLRTNNKYAPRTIDMDVIIWNDLQLDRGLWKYPHIAVPVSQILPYLTSPETGESLKSVADRLIKSYPINERPEIVNNFYQKKFNQSEIYLGSFKEPALVDWL